MHPGGNDRQEHAQASPRGLLRLLVALAASAALTGGGVWLWKAVLEDRLVPKRFGEVEAGAIYRSGQLSPALVEKTLARHGIRRVISLCADDPADAAQTAEQQAAEHLAIERQVFPLKGDGTGDIANYAAAIAAISQSVHQGQPVLVHCAAGAYRTGGVVAAYRLLVESADPSAVWEEMKEYDWDEDNPVLPEYLNRNMPELARRLVDMGVIERVPDPLRLLSRPPG
jgi:predicted protein tyrosine phosphatase